MLLPVPATPLPLTHTPGAGLAGAHASAHVSVHSSVLVLLGPTPARGEHCWPPGVTPDGDEPSVLRFYTCDYLPPHAELYLGKQNPRQCPNVQQITTCDTTVQRTTHVARLNEYKKMPCFGNSFIASIRRARVPTSIPTLHVFANVTGAVDIYVAALALPGGSAAVEPCLVCVEADACPVQVRGAGRAPSRLVAWCAALFGADATPPAPLETRHYARVHVLPHSGPCMTFERAVAVPTPVPAEFVYALQL